MNTKGEIELERPSSSNKTPRLRATASDSKKIKIVTQLQTYLNIAFGVVSLRLFAAFGLYQWLGLYLVLMPFMLELLLDFFFLGLAFVFTQKRNAVLEIIYISWLGLEFCINLIAFIILIPRVLMPYIFEPTGVVNEDWAWLWSGLVFYFVFSAFAMAICLTLIVVTALKLKWLKQAEDQPYNFPTKNEHRRRALFVAKYVAYIAAMIVIVIFVVLSIVSAVQSGTNYGDPCADRSDPACFEQCNPIDTAACVLPYPSSYYLRPDSSTETGYRVNLGPRTLPITKRGANINPEHWNDLDGFSTTVPLLFHLPQVVNDTMIPWWNLELFRAANVTTVLINTKTGERVPHWVEIDNVDPNSNLRVIIMQPATTLEFNTRYVVGVRQLTNSQGEVIPATAGMQVLIDKTASDDNMSQHYNSVIFPALAAQGFAREDVQLAWDFVTTSMKSLLGRAQHMRDDALRLYSDNNSKYDYVIDRIDDNECGVNASRTFARTIWGHFTTPNYLNGSGRGSMLPRENGKRVMEPQSTGTRNTNFVVRVPCSLTENPRPAKMVLEFGHGLFGMRDQSYNATMLAIMANQYDWVYYATDWYGMCAFDVLIVARILINDISTFPILPESVNQGWSSRVVGLKILMDKVRQDDALRFNGVSLITANTPRQYYGVSQGGILGGGFGAFHPEMTRFVLGVPGAPFALLLGRSTAFTMYAEFMKLQFYSWFDIRIVFSLMQSFWDSAEAGGWLTLMNRDVQPGIPAKQVLIQAAYGDALVTPLAAQIMARAYNASTITPVYEPLWGISEWTAPFNGSGIVIWKYRDIPLAPYDNVPPNQLYNTHGCPRAEKAGQDQIRDFLESGVINQYCDEKEGCVQDTCTIIQ